MPKPKAPNHGRLQTRSPEELSQRLAGRRISAESRGKWLEGALDLLLADPVLFGELPISQEEVLKRVFGAGYDLMAQSHPQPFDRGVQAVKLLVAKEFYRALASNSDPAAEALVMLWYRYLNPIKSGSSRHRASTATLLGFCREPANVLRMASEARRLLMGVPGTPTPPDEEDIKKRIGRLFAGKPRARRTFDDLLDRTLGSWRTCQNWW